MKLHMNRKKRSNVKRIISLALVCCMTFSMGSSYVSAGELNVPAAENEAAGYSIGGVESVPLDTQGDAGQDTNNIEETPSGAEQDAAVDVAPPDAALKADGQLVGDENQSGAAGKPADKAPADGTAGTSSSESQPAESQNPIQDENPADDSTESNEPMEEGKPQQPEGGSEPPAEESKPAQDGTANNDKEQDADDEPAQDVPSNDDKEQNSASQPGEDKKPADETSSDEIKDPTQQQTTDDKAEQQIPMENPADGTDGETNQSGDDNEQDTPIAFESSFSLQEMMQLSNDTAAGATWSLRNGGTGEEGNQEETDPAQQINWNFSAYYVNENDQYNIVKEDANFSLKYQMEFQTDESLMPYAVQIKIEQELFKDNKGNSVTPDEYGIPVGTPDKPSVSARTPFNYYSQPIKVTDPDTGEEIEKNYLIFFNYMTIPAGTHAAWQVLYKNRRMMSIPDGSSWQLKPMVSVYNGKADESSEERKAPLYNDPRRVYTEQQSLAGRTNASLSLNKVVKAPYSSTGKSYTPGLYTMSQLKNYISGSIPDQYIIKNEGEPDRLNTADWRFVVWTVEAEVNATMPWTLEVKDTPLVARISGKYGMVYPVMDEDNSQVQGGVVGWKERELKPGDPQITIPNGAEGAILQGCEKESWNQVFYVVTAYPTKIKEGSGEIDYELMAQNQIQMTLKPAVINNNEDKTVIKDAKAQWQYINYDWHYSGDVFRVSRNKTVRDYAGWLDAYKAASALDEDYGSLPHETKGTMNGYYTTHYIEGDKVGQYIDGIYYTMTTMDDFLVAEWKDQDQNSKSKYLTKEDYYFSSVTISQNDTGYDVWEDKESEKSDLTVINGDRLPKRTNAEGKTEDVFRLNSEKNVRQSEVRIWAKFSEPSGASGSTQSGLRPAAVKDGLSDSWELVSIEYMDADNPQISYTFSDALIARKPYQILVEHDSIDYRSECKIDTTVRMRAGSPVMQEILEDMGDIDRSQDNANRNVRFEGMAGIIATTWVGGTPIHYGHNSGNDDRDEKNPKPDGGTDGYDRIEGLQGKSEAEYVELPARDSDRCNLKWLSATAASYKTAKTSNDVNNNRVLVDYCLTAYDGYEIYDTTSLNYLTERDRSLINPGRNNVVFYDLLPKGMAFDASVPVKAGRITRLDNKKDYTRNPSLWDSTQVEVSVDSSEIVPNYRGIGRTLVVFRIAYSGADASFFTDGKWLEGWGVSFRAYYDWKDGDEVNKRNVNANLSAFMPDFSKAEYEFNIAHPELHGLTTQVYFDNGEFTNSSETVNSQLAAIYADLVKDDGSGKGNISKVDGAISEEDRARISDSRYILYANNVLQTDDMAVSFTGGIETLAKADADLFGTFTQRAMVPTGTSKSTDGLYAYNITVTAALDQTGIVVFDRLERADVDRKGMTNEPFDFDEVSAEWYGDFQSVDVNGLKKLGINPVIYYSDKRDALVPEKEGDNDPRTILSESSHWYTEARFQEVFGANGADWKSKVKAVAVDMTNTTKTETGTDGNPVPVPYTLKKEHSLSFQIRMKAPTEETSEPKYTYNNASYTCLVVDATAGGNGSRAVNESTAARVGRSRVETLEIIKRFGREVPSSVRNKSFAFTLYEEVEYRVYDEETKTYKIETRRQPLAYAEYKLCRADGSESGTSQGNQLKATDGNGTFYLRADEKAVFEAADVSRIKVEEKEDIFWAAASTDQKDEANHTRTFTMTNTYRPVLYLEKELSGISADPVKTEESAETLNKKGISYVEEAGVRYITLTEDVRQKYEFTFLVERKVGGQWQPLANAEYWYVDGVRLDGGSPVRVDENGNVPDDGQFRQAKTDQDGYLTIHSGQIAALFPGYVGTEYRITEKEVSPDWTIEDSKRTAEGTLETRGSSETFTNYYKWKNLYLKKKLEGITEDQYNALPDAEKGFTFQVEMVENPKPGSASASEDGLVHTPVRYLKWQLLDKTGTVVTEDKLGSDGSFTCAVGFGTVRIIGLEAGKTYIVKETGVPEVTRGQQQKALYQPVNDTVEVKISPWNTRREAEIVNRYLRRSLSVSKTVMKTQTGEENGENEETGLTTENGDSSAANLSFDFLAEINGAPVAVGTMYKVIDQSGATETCEITVAGEFKLENGQTALFQDIGLIGDSYQVWEKVVTEANDPRSQYQQVTPTEQADSPSKEDCGAPGFGSFTKEAMTAEVFFVNLYGDGGNLLISKEYMVGSNAGPADQQLIEEWKEDVRNSHGGSLKATESWLVANNNIIFQQQAVEFTLEVKPKDGESYVWPGPGDCDVDGDGNLTGYVTVQYINQLNSQTGSILWPAGATIKVYPWVTIIVPGDKLPEESVYTLKEEPGSQHRILKPIYYAPTYPSTGGATNGSQIGIGGTNGAYIQISQSGPKNDQAVTGTLAEKSVATIYNEVTTIVPRGSSVLKTMVPGSKEVSPGAELVYRVEKYENGAWVPAEGIKYLKGGILPETGTTPRSRMGGTIGTSINMNVISTQIETTGADGKIVVSSYRVELGTGNKPYVDFYPIVQFLEDIVFVNQYGESDNGTLSDPITGEVYPDLRYLRIVELQEESSDEWGSLAGYGGYLRQQMFINSNVTSPVEIAKNMSEGYNNPDEPFTLVLKQVVGFDYGKYDELVNMKRASGSQSYTISQAGDAIAYALIEFDEEGDPKEDDDGNLVMDYHKRYQAYKDIVTAQEPRKGISYTVHNADGKTAGTGVTGANGEIQLLAGQYVTLNLPQGTLWTVTEKQDATPNYRLVNLDPKPGSTELIWLNSNLMMINMRTEQQKTEDDLLDELVNMKR